MLPSTGVEVASTWYSVKRLWRAARDRGFQITSGLKSNRWIRVENPTCSQGWRWQQLADYAAGLSASDYASVRWPGGDEDEQVYVHVVSTQVRHLYCCRVVIARRSLDVPLWQTRYWTSSDLETQMSTLLSPISARWDIEVLFGDAKDLLGLDQYQLMSATVILQFWTLVMLAYAFLDAEQDQLQHQR